MNRLTVIDSSDIQDKIYTIRGVHVMLDRDLAALYQVETKVLNQAVKRNIQRFPQNFRFQLTKEELENLNTKYLPYVFIEQGACLMWNEK